LSFNYGQRHGGRELQLAIQTANKLGIQHDILSLQNLTHLLGQSGSSLVSANEVPEGHYAADNMKSTVVPNRNMIMLSIASGVAIAEGAEAVYTGVHAGDHFIYPDCRPQFLAAANAAVAIGNSGFGPIPEQMENVYCDQYLFAPYIDKSKADIAYRALELGVPLEDTWSCYKGGEIHCGRCGTCVERLEAIDEAGQCLTIARGYSSLRDGIAPEFQDKTVYADKDYWREALAERTV
jgi:7-cyano-7-deazaguanine synthase